MQEQEQGIAIIVIFFFWLQGLSCQPTIEQYTTKVIRMVDFSHELVGADSIAELGELAVRQAVAVRGRDAPHCF